MSYSDPTAQAPTPGARQKYAKVVGDQAGTAMLKAMEEKNVALLRESKKDLDLLEGVYGPEGIKE